MFKASTDLYINHDEFFLVNDSLKDFNDKKETKEAIKNPENSLSDNRSTVNISRKIYETNSIEK